VNRGVIYMLRGDYRSALTDFDQAVGLNAGLGEALVDRGIARIALGSVPRASPTSTGGSRSAVDA
jgi:hypothetical protein